MHLGCRTFLVSAAVGLALAPAAMADDGVSDFYFARDACGGTDPQNIRLDTELGAFTSGCGSLVGVTDAEDAMATPTVPLTTLDTTRKIYVAVVTGDFSGAGIGLGAQHVDVALTGKDAKNKVVTIAKDSHTKDAQSMVRGADYTEEFELPVKPDLKGPYKQFTLTLTVGGSQFAGYVDFGGGSFIELPTAPTATKKARVNRR